MGARFLTSFMESCRPRQSLCVLQPTSQGVDLSECWSRESCFVLHVWERDKEDSINLTVFRSSNVLLHLLKGEDQTIHS